MLNRNDTATMAYHERGLTALAADYLSAFVQDATAALLAGDRASDDQLQALARIENGCRGHTKDLIIDSLAKDICKPSSFVWLTLRARAVSRAQEIKSGKRGLRWTQTGRGKAGARVGGARFI